MVMASRPRKALMTMEIQATADTCGQKCEGNECVCACKYVMETVVCECINVCLCDNGEN